MPGQGGNVLTASSKGVDLSISGRSRKYVGIKLREEFPGKIGRDGGKVE